MFSLTSAREFGRRLARYVGRNEFRNHPAMVLERRATYELRRRFAPQSLNHDRLVTLSDRARMWVRLSDDIERNVYLLGVYEHATASVLARAVAPGSFVIDIGAHVGQYTLLAAVSAGASGLVWAFEPQPLMRARLVRNIAVNRLENVEVRDAAVWDLSGQVAFHAASDQPNSGLASVCTDDVCAGPHVLVAATTIDEALAAADGRPVDVMKIDIEGGEERALTGANRALSEYPVIFIEANDLAPDQDGVSSPAIDLLRDRGYRIYAPDATKRALPLVQFDRADDPRQLQETGRPLNLVAIHDRSRMRARLIPEKSSL